MIGTVTLGGARPTTKPCCAFRKLNAHLAAATQRAPSGCAAASPLDPQLAAQPQPGIFGGFPGQRRLALARSPEAGAPGRSGRDVNQLNADTSFTALCLPPEIRAGPGLSSNLTLRPEAALGPLNLRTRWAFPAWGCQRGPASRRQWWWISSSPHRKEMLWANLPHESSATSLSGCWSSGGQSGAGGQPMLGDWVHPVRTCWNPPLKGRKAGGSASACPGSGWILGVTGGSS